MQVFALEGGISWLISELHKTQAAPASSDLSLVLTPPWIGAYVASSQF